MDRLEEFKAAARKAGHRIVLPEGEDARIIAAAEIILRDGIGFPVLLGDPAIIVRQAEAAHVSLAGIEIVDPGASAKLSAFAGRLARERERLSEGMALRLLRKPLYFGGMMVGCDEAAAMVAGVANPTRRVIEAGLMTVGLAEGITTPSSFMLMLVPTPRAAGSAPMSMPIAPSPSILRLKSSPTSQSPRRAMPKRCFMKRRASRSCPFPRKEARSTPMSRR